MNLKKVLKQIIQSMQLNFCGRLHHMYILNPSSMVNLIWKTISGFVDPRTQEKISFLSDGNMHILQDSISPGQLQKKYGGNQPNITEFWPPKNIDSMSEELVDTRRELNYNHQHYQREEREISIEQCELSPYDYDKSYHPYQEIVSKLGSRPNISQSGKMIYIQSVLEKSVRKQDTHPQAQTPSSNPEENQQHPMFDASPTINSDAQNTYDQKHTKRQISLQSDTSIVQMNRETQNQLINKASSHQLEQTKRVTQMEQIDESDLPKIIVSEPPIYEYDTDSNDNIFLVREKSSSLCENQNKTMKVSDVSTDAKEPFSRRSTIPKTFNSLDHKQSQLLLIEDEGEQSDNIFQPSPMLVSVSIRCVSVPEISIEGPSPNRETSCCSCSIF